jgi:hypothetical protein
MESGGKEVQLLLIQDLDTSGKWSEPCPCRAIPPTKGPMVTMGQEAGLAPEAVWTQSLEGK